MSSKNMHRRDFLKRSTLSAATALALPAFVPRHVLGFAGTPGANEQIVLSIVGMGVRGDGQPIRFWGGSDYNQRELSYDDLVRHAQFLAKRGVNIVRWHGHLPPVVPKRVRDGQSVPAPTLSAINEKELDEAFKLVAA